MQTIDILLKVWQTVEVPDEVANNDEPFVIEDYLTLNNKWPSIDTDGQEWTQEVIR